MTTTLTNLELARQWSTLSAVVASAFFAGMIWWLARRHFQTRYELEDDCLTAHGDLRLKLTIRNRGNNTVMVEAISVKPPLGIVIAEKGGYIGGSYAKPEHLTAEQVSSQIRVKQDETYGTSLALRRTDGFASSKTVSIRLHILTSFPVIRHKKKVLTAILPAKIRNAQE